MNIKHNLSLSTLVALTLASVSHAQNFSDSEVTTVTTFTQLGSNLSVAVTPTFSATEWYPSPPAGSSYSFDGSSSVSGKAYTLYDTTDLKYSQSITQFIQLTADQTFTVKNASNSLYEFFTISVAQSGLANYNDEYSPLAQDQYLGPSSQFSASSGKVYQNLNIDYGTYENDYQLNSSNGYNTGLVELSYSQPGSNYFEDGYTSSYLFAVAPSSSTSFTVQELSECAAVNESQYNVAHPTAVTPSPVACFPFALGLIARPKKTRARSV